MVNLQELARLSDIEYEAPIIKKVIPKKEVLKENVVINLLETENYKSSINIIVKKLLKTAEASINRYSHSKGSEVIQINNKKYTSSESKGYIVITIDGEDIRKAGVPAEEIAYELFSNKEKYKESFNISDLLGNEKYSIDDIKVYIKNTDVNIKVNYSSEDKEEELVEEKWDFLKI